MNKKPKPNTKCFYCKQRFFFCPWLMSTTCPYCHGILWNQMTPLWEAWKDLGKEEVGGEDNS